MAERPLPQPLSATGVQDREIRADEHELELAMIEAQLRGRERQLLASREALLRRGQGIEARERSVLEWAVQAGEPGLRLAGQLPPTPSPIAQSDEHSVLPRIALLSTTREQLLQHKEAWLQQRKADLLQRQAEVAACETALPRIETALALRERKAAQTATKLQRLLADLGSGVAMPELPGQVSVAIGWTEAAPTDRLAPAPTPTTTRKLTGMPMFRPVEQAAAEQGPSEQSHKEAPFSHTAVPLPPAAPRSAARLTAGLPQMAPVEGASSPPSRILVDRQSWADARHADTWTIARDNITPEAKTSSIKRKTTPISSDVWSRLLESSGSARRRAGRRSSGLLLGRATLSTAQLSGVRAELMRLGEIDVPRGRIEFDRPTKVLLLSVSGERPDLGEQAELSWDDQGELVSLSVKIRRVVAQGTQTWVVMAAAEGCTELELDRLATALGQTL
jgi:hypothetical protein